MSLIDALIHLIDTGFPRSRGDEPIDNIREQLAYWFSPLTRG